MGSPNLLFNWPHSNQPSPAEHRLRSCAAIMPLAIETHRAINRTNGCSADFTSSGPSLFYVLFCFSLTNLPTHCATSLCSLTSVVAHDRVHKNDEITTCEHNPDFVVHVYFMSN